MTNKIQTHKYLIAEKLDEMADISEYWKRHRDKCRNPNAIRTAMIMLANEIIILANQKQDES